MVVLALSTSGTVVLTVMLSVTAALIVARTRAVWPTRSTIWSCETGEKPSSAKSTL